jgi:hypothetical protein
MRGNFNNSHDNQKLSILMITSSMNKKARTRFETFSLNFFFKLPEKTQIMSWEVVQTSLHHHSPMVSDTTSCSVGCQI